MSKPFFERLQNYYASVASSLRQQSNSASIFNNNVDIGMSREKHYADFLKQHIPSTCNVIFGGFLFDQDGNESKQIDILVTHGNTLNFRLNSSGEQLKSFTCIDGCIAIAGIKSNLNSSQLIDSLDNFASLPEKRKIFDRIDKLADSKKNEHSYDEFEVMPFLKIDDKFYEDWPLKIIYASSGLKIENAVQVLKDYYRDRSDIPYRRRPNIIHVAGQYVIERIPYNGGKDRMGTQLSPHCFHAMPEYSDSYGLLRVVTQIQSITTVSNYIFYNYSSLIKNMRFQQK